VLDIDALRADTPGTDRVVHLGNAGAALQPRPVLDAVVAHLRLESEIGGYEAAAAAAAAAAATYPAVAGLLGCDPDEVALLPSATLAWDMAFWSIRFRPGDRILTGRAEYASNDIAIRAARERHGVTVDVVPDDEHGQLDVGALAGMVDERVKLIALCHVPTNNGLVSPAAEVGAVARAAGVLFLLDACQSVGQLPVDVRAIGCDLLSFTGRKFVRGPRGTGALFVRREIMDQLDPPFPDLHSAERDGSGYRLRGDARRFETWESDLAASIGLGVAARYALTVGPVEAWARIQALADRLRGLLAGLDGVTVDDVGAVRGGIVTFRVDGADPYELRNRLRARHINVGVVAGGLLGEPAADKMRASVHYYNTDEELDRLVAALR
jgi:cysteine desulfurase / selenocysteine lyase